ncbi:MAG: ABC transporter substrate-binding protein [Fusobacteriota bacterium]
MRMRKKIVLVLMAMILISVVSISDDGMKKNEKKKIVFVKDDNSDFFNGFATYIEGEFKKNGWTEENSEFIVLSMDGKIEKAKENIKEIKEIDPDLVYINGTYIEDRIIPLKKTDIPVVAIANIDYMKDGEYVFLNEKEKPISNVTGVYGFTENFELNAFKLLNQIAPIEDKKVVVLTQPQLFQRSNFEEALKKLDITLKEYKEFKYFENFQEALLKYNKDPEVGWIIADGPITRKDGKEWTRKDTFHWEHKNIEKPNIALYQNNVENGALAGLAVDPMGYVGPSLELCYKILEGEDPKDIDPVYPDKSLILLNMKAAKQIGIDFPIDIINASWKIYTDYEGTTLGE